MSKIVETAENEEGTEVTGPVDEPRVPKPIWPVGLPTTGICLGEELLNSHLGLTAPERDGFFLPTEGWELREDSWKLYRGLDPANTMQAMIATLAVGVFNTSLSVIADGNRQDRPGQARDINLRHGIKGAVVAAELLKVLKQLQDGGEKRVSVGAVNVAAGGQAIVGNVESGKPHKRAGKGARRKTNRKRAD